MMPGEGALVTFEGMEGAGKSTLISLVEAALRGRGLDPLVTREPGGTALGNAIRSLLLDPSSRGMDPCCELMLLCADRAQHVAQVLVPALSQGRLVLCDRYSDSTFAYQGYGRGIAIDLVREMDAAARGGISPLLTALVDLPPERGLARARGRNRRGGSHETRFDDEEIAFHRRVREGFLTLASGEPERFLLLDGELPAEELGRMVLAELARRMPGAP
jgi:dTMP kinase